MIRKHGFSASVPLSVPLVGRSRFSLLDAELERLLREDVAERRAREERLIISHFGSLERALHMATTFPGRYQLEDRLAYDGTLSFYDLWTKVRTSE